jgi:hypothetical protein
MIIFNNAIHINLVMCWQHLHSNPTIAPVKTLGKARVILLDQHLQNQAAVL